MSTGVGLARHCARLFSLGLVIRLLVVAALALAGQAAWGAAIEGLAVVSNPQDEWYAAGDDIRVRATFDEAVRVRHLINDELKLRINIGGRQREAALIDDRPARQFTFSYRVQDGDEDTDGIQVDAPAFTGGSFVDQDDDTNVNVATTTLATLDGHKVDAVRPEVLGQPAVVSDPGVDNTYVVGDVIEIEIDFDDEIRVRGEPELVLSIGRTGAAPPTGPISRRASLDRTRPTRLVFRYEVQAGDQDPDGIRIQADALTGGVIEDVRGNPARREFVHSDYANHRIDTQAPSVVGVEITSAPASGNTYGAGEVIEVQVTYDEVVYNCGTPQLRLDVGGRQPYANYVDGSGTTTFAFRYVVEARDQDDDGISIGPDALDGCVEDAAGTTYAARIDPVPEQPNHRVDGNTTNPSATEVDITSSGGDDGYRIGDDIEVEVSFNVPVFVREPREPDEDAELRLILDIGGNSRYATFVDGSGTETLRFRYIVQAGDHDEDGISIGPNALVGARIEDADGTVASRGFPTVRRDRRQTVDAQRPAADDPPRVVSNAGPVYGRGERIDIELTLTEPVHVTQTDDDTLALILSIGDRSRRARFVAGSGTNRLEFRYTVRRDDVDGDGFTIGPDALVGAVIEDNAGNDWSEAERRLVPLRASSSNRVDGGRADDSAPFVKFVNVRFVRGGGRIGNGGSYELGDAVEITITFSENVYTPGSPPVLEIAIGGNLRNAVLTEGGGSSELTFRYVVQGTDEGTVSIGPGELALLGGTIVDSAGNVAQRDFEPQPASSRHRVDGVAPEVEQLELHRGPRANKTYRLGEPIEVHIRYSEPVYVTGTLQLVISIGENSRRATFIDGSGSDTLKFRYVVQRGDRDDDGISIGPDALVGGTIEDRAGNDWGEAQRRLPPLERQHDHLVDAAGRTATVQGGLEIVCMESRACEEDAAPYGAGDDIEIELSFSEEVHVTGTPLLTLLIGSTPRTASLADGSGTNVLTFRYTVQPGDYDEDGISIGAGPRALVGGTIQDSAGFDVDRSFEALPADGAHKVDAIEPRAQSVSITSTPAAASTYREGERIEVAVQFDDDVRIVNRDDLNLALTIGDHSGDAKSTQSSGTTTRTLNFRYTVKGGDFDADGISIGGNALTGRLEDRVGEDVDNRLDPLPNQSGHLVGAEIALALQLDLMVNGPPGVFDLYDQVLVPQGIRHYAGTYQDPASDDSSVATARVSGHRLVITPHAEGTAAILVTARDATITLLFAVTVSANQTEVAILEHALAAMGRGVLASAAYTIGTRLETKRRNPLLAYGRRVSRVDGAGAGPQAPGSMQPRHGLMAGCAYPATRACERQALSAHGIRTFDAAAGDAFDRHSQWQGAARRYPRDMSFEMPLIGGVNRDTAWALWGAGDFSSFEGEPDSARFEGDLSAAYVGVDARGEGWLAGAAVGRVDGDADYQFTVDDRTSKGNLQTTLTVVNPYVQWSLGENGRMWAMAGVGDGEASIKREDRASPAAPTDLTMRMGMAGLRAEIAKAGNFRFALRGDVGSVQLETDNGETAVHGLAVNVQRARVGVETSFPLVSERGGELTPFIDIGARYDGGDGQTGAGAEVAAGVRASSGALRFEAKARTLVMEGADGYSETGASATVVIEPGSDGNGLRLSLAPRWGGADDAMDVFWRRDGGNGLKAFKREMERGWGVASRVEYGMSAKGRRDGAATVRPFGEVDMADDNQRVRVGMAYHFSHHSDKPLKLEVSSERVKQAAGTEQRFLLSAEGRF